jgi:hypothetical protein
MMEKGNGSGNFRHRLYRQSEKPPEKKPDAKKQNLKNLQLKLL